MEARCMLKASNLRELLTQDMRIRARSLGHSPSRVETQPAGPEDPMTKQNTLSVTMVLRDNNAVGGLESSFARLAPYFKLQGLQVSALLVGGKAKHSAPGDFLSEHIPTSRC